MNDPRGIAEMASQLEMALEVPGEVDWSSVATAIDWLPRRDSRRERLGVLFCRLGAALTDHEDPSEIRREILLILSQLCQ